jgi:hypothetical protein
MGIVMPMKHGPRVSAIFVFNDVEPLDFCGPFEVFISADKVGGGGLFSVFTAAESSHRYLRETA